MRAVNPLRGLSRVTYACGTQSTPSVASTSSAFVSFSRSVQSSSKSSLRNATTPTDGRSERAATRSAGAVDRRLHTSPSLDPPEAVATTSHSQVATSLPEGAQDNDWDVLASSIGGSQTEAECVYVPLSHLHESTQPAELEAQHVPLSAHVFGQLPRRDIMHSAVVYYLDSQRSGTANTKTRGEVNFSGRKIRPQKGSGHARLGTRSNPLLRKGGVIHGPKPRDFATDLPRRVRELALRSALSARWNEGKLHVVPTLYWDAPPKVTGNLSRTLKERGWDDVLFLTAPRDPQPGVKAGIRQRSGRPSACDPTYTEAEKDQHGVDLQHFAIALANIPDTELIRLDMLTEEAQEDAKKPEDKKKPGELHAYEVLLRQNLVLDLGALEWLEAKLGGPIVHEDASLLTGLGAEGTLQGDAADPSITSTESVAGTYPVSV
ncbi:unnamed protein product [Parajaminaea phylloscopi]